LIRDLEKLKNELATYTNEKDIWIIQDGISNSAGNLCLHLVGNLKHFIGFISGGIAYTREREKEFSDRDIPRSEITRQIDETTDVLQHTLSNMTPDDFAKKYPLTPLGYEMTVEYFIIHLAMHLNYHLGQINYHRRLLNK